MKLTGKMMGKLTAFIVAVAAVSLVATAQAQTKPGKAVVRGLTGSADVSDGTGVWKPLRSGKTVQQGSMVRSSAGSEVTLFLDQNGPIVQVTELSAVSFDRVMFDRVGDEYVVDTRLELKSGIVKGQVRKTSSASKYEIKTANMVVGIRGPADYVVTSAGKVSILGGQAVVVYVDPQSGETSTTVVNSGQTFDPALKAARPSAPGEVPVISEFAKATQDLQEEVIEVSDFIAPIPVTTEYRPDHNEDGEPQQPESAVED